MASEQPEVEALPQAGPRVRRLGGRLVSVTTTPGARPPVVLLGGCGVPYYLWDEVVAQLTGLEVVRPDRPGLVATSWPGELPRLASEVATLADLIADLDSPPIVVAHSMASLHAEALIRQHPGSVAALVLVDGSVSWDPSPPSSGTAWRWTAHAVRRLMRFRVVRPLGSLGNRVTVTAQSKRRLFDPMPAVETATYRRPDTVASVVAENAAYDEQVQDLNEVRRSFAWLRLPTLLLTASGDGGPDWVSAQARFAELLGGQQTVVADSRHLMMIDRPDAIAAAVRSLVRKIAGD